MARTAQEPHEDSEAAEIARAFRRRDEEPQSQVREVPVEGEPDAGELESPQAYRHVETCRGRSIDEIEAEWKEEREAEKRGEAPKGPTFAEMAARMSGQRRGGAA